MKFLSHLVMLSRTTLSYSVKIKCRNLHSCVLKHDNAINYRKVEYLLREKSAGIHFSAGMYVKSFRETENEYAHELLQTMPAYAESTVKQPSSVKMEDYSECNKALIEFAKNTSTEDKSESCLVFVYGTLKVNEPNYDQMTAPSLGKATYVSRGRTVQKWPLVIASRFNIPFLLYKEDVGKNIIGEIFLVDKSMLSHMDAFECHPTYYTRIQTEVEVLERENATKYNLPMIVKPWVYFLMRFRPELLTLPYLEDYQSKGSHGREYICRYTRPPGQDYYDDVKIEDTTDPDDIYK